MPPEERGRLEQKYPALGLYTYARLICESQSKEKPTDEQAIRLCLMAAICHSKGSEHLGAIYKQLVNDFPWKGDGDHVSQFMKTQIGQKKESLNIPLNQEHLEALVGEIESKLICKACGKQNEHDHELCPPCQEIAEDIAKDEDRCPVCGVYFDGSICDECHDHIEN